MNVKYVKFYLNFESLMYQVTLATVHWRWGGFVLNSLMHCVECKSTRFLHTLISAYNPVLEGNCPHSQNLSLPYMWRPARSYFQRRRRRKLLL